MRKEISPIHVGDISIKADKNYHIAGPCTVESSQQVFDIAENTISRGIDAYRGGAFKPRTDPDAFQGLGEDGLDILFEVGRFYNIPVVTEVMEQNQISLIRKKSKSHPFIYQVGTRNAQNYPLLRDVGETGIPVILKRGKGSKVSEMISAAGYITKGGSPVVMCERGIETFSSASGTGRATADLLAITQFQEAGFITLFDPSHAGGMPEYVVRLALASIAAGANGTIVEVGVVDEQGKCHAQCDAQQALSYGQFTSFLQRAKEIEKLVK
ncbi:3-deoxy-7-phosphoheptulonate synthase [Candidatus Roizmanbacteria bacterium]|nr:3-deoxy-7-phosphoheptulonate synthase [Candidatus Roizmanbacteria bacterium]